MTERNPSKEDNELIESDNDSTDFNTEFGKQIDRKLTRHQLQVSWRRSKILQLMVTGITSTYKLSEAMRISQSTCFRDVRFLKKQATKELQTHIQERVPWQYKICSEGISEVLRYAWSMILKDNGKGNKIATLSLIAQCYKDLLEISTNAGIVTEALSAVEKVKQEILVLKQSNNNGSDTS